MAVAFDFIQVVLVQVAVGGLKVRIAVDLVEGGDHVVKRAPKPQAPGAR